MNAFWLNSLLVEKLSIFLQWLGVILVLSGSSVVTAQTAQQIYNINLPTLTVAEALTSLSEQTGVPVFFSYDLVKNQTSNPVKGKYTALDALRMLLRNTRFTGSLSKGGVLMITDSNMTRTNDKQTNGRETSAMNTKKKSLILSILSALAPISGTSYAIAEESESRSRIDEVIVTARKRAELLTEVPMTITAVSGEILMERGITSITSLPEVTSGLTVSVNANSQVSFRVRGLGSETSSESFEQSVPLFIDGMYQGRSQSYVQSMFDIAQVEIVKGTESSLLGKNTSLGAVSLTTRKPGDELAFNVTTSYEFELDSHNIESGVDIPLANNMALRLAGQVRKQGGWVENPLLGEDYPETKSVAGRGVFVWEPSSDLDITLLYQRFDTKTLGQPEEIVTDLSGGGRARAEVAGYFDFETNLNYVNASSDPGFGTTKDNMVGNAAIATINYDIDGYTLTSVSSYSDYDLFKPFDADLLPGRWAAYDPINQDSKQLTQELRISSPAEGRFNYVAGLFYLTEEWHQDRIWRNPATPPNGLTGEMFEQTDIELETFSAFGQMNYDITEQFGLTLGLRYTEEERTADFIRETIVSGLLTSFLFPEINGNKTRTESHVDGSIGFQYTPNETVLYYASFSRGTKGGGFLNLPTSIAASEFEEEQADTIELGAKINIDRGTVAIALFKTEIDDYQQNLFNGASFDSVQVPLKSEGVDFEAYLAITDNLRFDAQVTYANTLNKDVGYEPQNSPLWSGNVNLTYTTPLVNNGLDISGSVGVAYKSDILWNTLERTIGRSPNGDIYGTDAHSLVNANLALSSGDEWTISLIGKNLTDKKYVSYARVGSFTGTTNAALGMPRTLALQFSYHYN